MTAFWTLAYYFGHFKLEVSAIFPILGVYREKNHSMLNSFVRYFEFETLNFRKLERRVTSGTLLISHHVSACTLHNGTQNCNELIWDSYWFFFVKTVPFSFFVVHLKVFIPDASSSWVARIHLCYIGKQHRQDIYALHPYEISLFVPVSNRFNLFSSEL